MEFIQYILFNNYFSIYSITRIFLIFHFLKAIEYSFYLGQIIFKFSHLEKKDTTFLIGQILMEKFSILNNNNNPDDHDDPDINNILKLN
uniref:Uncharacterized protein n=1 Tax=Pithovirus LCPAC104 TaxID=2506589 RepID=A0A481Z3T9_9VIRU|nr:MAG: hypothetical protein LCPAC104_00590 [Pithovirus LCPAC104]